LGALSDSAATNKLDDDDDDYNNNDELETTHIFFPVAIETAGSWGHQAIELVQEIGRRIADITVDSRGTTFLFQRLSVALQRGNAVSFLGTFPSE